MSREVCAIRRLRGATAGAARLSIALLRIALVRWFALIAATATPQCGIEASDEGMTVDRLAEEGDGTGRLRALADSLFGKGGNEDDRHVRTAYGQLFLELQSPLYWHLHVRVPAHGVI